MQPLITTYSPQEVSDLLGLPKSTILSAIDRGELPVIRYNARVFRITAIDTSAWFGSKGGKLKSTTSTTSTTPTASTLPAESAAPKVSPP